MVNSPTSAFSPEQTESCGVQHIDIFHAHTPTTHVLFWHDPEALSLEEVLWFNPGWQPNTTQPLGHLPCPGEWGKELKG